MTLHTQHTLIDLQSEFPGSGVYSQFLLSGNSPYSARTLGDFIADTSHSKQIDVSTGAPQASGSVTFSSFVQNDTVTLNGQAITGVATPSGTTQFALGADDSETATSFSSFINTTSVARIYRVLSASTDGANVIVKSVVPGLVGNALTLAISDHGSVSGARLVGGTEGNTVTIKI